uniref:Ig-like domain-containing protein n=1 Tax=Esox lucius TaxID=8010 RepID=A0AAY5L1X2_ESOLU
MKRMYSMLLSIFFAGGSYEQTIEPNQHEVYVDEGNNVHLSCNYTSANSLLWYKQSPGSAPQYLMIILEKTQVDLYISSAEVTDSALYYCALRPTVTGNPETQKILPTSKSNHTIHSNRIYFSTFYLYSFCLNIQHILEQHTS